MAYEPLIPAPGLDAGGLAEYVLEELRRVADALAEVTEVRLVELNVAPDRPRDGMIVLADGTNFNPGSGAGFYGRSAGAWVFLG